MKFFLLILILKTGFEERAIEILKRGEPPHTPKVFEELEDGAIGISDAGELSNVTTNWGIISPTPIQFTPTLHWPSNAPFQHQYSFGTMFFAGIEGNIATVHNRFAPFTSDWTPIKKHSGTVTNPDGWPILATSNDPNTWPDGVWPGPWRRDPLTGEVVEGEFTSDQDIYCEYDDRNNPRGPLGLEVHQIAYSYGRSYAEDILFYRMILINRSDDTLHNMYMGVIPYLLVDFDLEDLLRFVDGNPLDQDTNPNFVYVWDVDGVPQSPWESLGLIGVAVVETPYNLGITDFHYYDRTYEPTTDEGLWQIVASDTGDTFIDPSHFFHGDNIHIDETPPGSPGRYAFVLSSGPFDLPPHDSVEFSIAYVAGSDSADLFTNVKTAFKMKERYYQGPSAPPPPRLRAVAGDGYVKLYWDSDPSETTPDPFTGEYDFEGYRIYRSEDGGETWGEAIVDYKGNVVGYVPIASFDLIDGIYGPDPANPWQSLGNETGIVHSFVDSTVINGVTYWYAITAYDRGNQHPDSLMPSLESPLGRPEDPQVVEVTPGLPPENWEPGYVEGGETLSPYIGNSDALIVVDVIDPDSLTGHTYEIVFDSSGGELTFSLIDMDLDTILLDHLPLPQNSLDGIKVVDGFRLIIKNTEPGYSEVGWHTQDTTTFDWWVEDRGRGEAVRRGDDDFVIVVSPDDSIVAQVLTIQSWSEDTPFVEVDTTFTIPIKAFVVTDPENPVPVSRVYVVEPRYLYPQAPSFMFSPIGWDLEPGGLAWVEDSLYRDKYPDQIGLVYYKDGDSSLVFVRTQNGPPGGIAPLPGDSFFIKVHRPLEAGDVYRFRTVRSSYGAEAELERIKVVPNPYILQAGWETTLGENKLMFTHLPGKAKIHIFNLAGEHIVTLEKNDSKGYLFWDLKTKYGLKVSYGIYIYVVETERGRKVGKFAVIR